MSGIYTDENGYKRKKYSNLVHRQTAYKKIYLKNRDKYSKPFSYYVVHHIDGHKKNNNVSNLMILSKEEHEKIHGIEPPQKTNNDPPATSHEPIPKNNKSDKKKSFSVTKLILAIIIVLLIIYLGSHKTKNYVNSEDIVDKIVQKISEDPNFAIVSTTTTKITTTTTSTTTTTIIEPIIVLGGSKNIEITNNLNQEISLNVTYRVVSSWFGKDSTETKVFTVEANNSKSFLVYDNAGCHSNRCSVSIIEYNEI